MPRCAPEELHEARCFIFLCQECQGDLAPYWRRFPTLQTWECQRCHTRWVYTERGWERV